MSVQGIAADGISGPSLVLPVYKPAGTTDPSLASGAKVDAQFDTLPVTVPTTPDKPPVTEAPPAQAAVQPARPASQVEAAVRPAALPPPAAGPPTVASTYTSRPAVGSAVDTTA